MYAAQLPYTVALQIVIVQPCRWSSTCGQHTSNLPSKQLVEDQGITTQNSSFCQIRYLCAKPYAVLQQMVAHCSNVSANRPANLLSIAVGTTSVQERIVCVAHHRVRGVECIPVIFVPWCIKGNALGQVRVGEEVAACLAVHRRTQVQGHHQQTW